MYKWFFVAYFITVAAQEEKSYTFNQEEDILAECILQQLVNTDGRYKPTQVANDVAHLAARRFHDKTMSSNKFFKRFNDFNYHLRRKIIKNNIDEDQLTEELRVALRDALIVCANTITQREDVATQISFDSNRHFLSKCIESHLKLTGCQEFQHQDGITESIADSAAIRFLGKSLSKKEFHRRYYFYFRHLREKKLVDHFNTGRLSRKLELTVKQAVRDCAMDQRPLVAVPIFENEPSEIAHILNLILVKWPNDLYHMIQSKNDRAILRKYANDAFTALMSELNVFQYDTQRFRIALRSLWDNRAREMFDINYEDQPYIVHQYTLKYPTPHMLQLDLEKFIHRKNASFRDRNPPVTELQLYEILNIHVPDRSKIDGDVDIYDDYIDNDMTSSEYYFEKQLNQFYRIIFFIIELCARGICTDENDLLYGALPDNLVHKEIQAIVYSNDAYRDYLMSKKLFYKSFIVNDNAHNKIAQNLLNSARLLEENLILLMSNVPSTSKIQSRSESVTTISTISQTTQFFKRKDDVWKNKNGKCFPKRAKMTTVSDICNIDDNLDVRNFDEVTTLTIQESSNCFVSGPTDDDPSVCLSDEFSESLNREKMETDDLYAYVIKKDGSKETRFTYEELLFIRDMSCFSDDNQTGVLI